MQASKEEPRGQTRGQGREAANEGSRRIPNDATSRNGSTPWYTIIPNDLLDACLRGEVPDRALKLWRGLWQHVKWKRVEEGDDELEVHPGTEALTRLTGLSARAQQRAALDLKSGGWIVREARRRNRSTVRWLVNPTLRQESRNDSQAVGSESTNDSQSVVSRNDSQSVAPETTARVSHRTRAIEREPELNESKQLEKQLPLCSEQQSSTASAKAELVVQEDFARAEDSNKTAQVEKARAAKFDAARWTRIVRELTRVLKGRGGAYVKFDLRQGQAHGILKAMRRQQGGPLDKQVLLAALEEAARLNGELPDVADVVNFLKTRLDIEARAGVGGDMTPLEVGTD